MKLTTLICDKTQVSDLSPLEEMSLTEIQFTPKTITRGLDVVRQMKSLKTIAIGDMGQLTETFAPDDFWKKYDAGDFGKPATSSRLAYLDPAFQQWMKDVQALPAEKQIKAVSKKLIELNPGFDGNVLAPIVEAGNILAAGKGPPQIVNGVVSEVAFVTDDVTDLSAVRALLGLRVLVLCGSADKSRLSDVSPLQGMQLNKLSIRRTQVSDLSPLQGMPLTRLDCGYTQVSDLSPLQEMPLTILDLPGTGVSDLSPLRGLPLKELDIHRSRISDLSPLAGIKLNSLWCSEMPISGLGPLRGMPLTRLICYSTHISDLSPLQGMKLKYLDCRDTLVSDLSPVQGMPLTILHCGQTSVSDLSPLRGMQLTELWFTPKAITRGMEAVRQTKSLTRIVFGAQQEDALSSDDFWKRYDAGDFGKPDAKKLAYLDPTFQQWVKTTQALPAEQQIEAVRSKLMELNPGFDGKVVGANGKGTPKIENGVVTGLGVFHANVRDISPIRALAALKALGCGSDGLGRGKIADLSPLQGLRLNVIYCSYSQVSDLSPLEGMPLTILECAVTRVSDLAPVQRMPLRHLSCSSTEIADLSPLLKITTLSFLNVRNTQVSPASVAALQKALPNCSIAWDDPAKAVADQPNKPWDTPELQHWVTDVQALPAEKQLEAVSKKLVELNPGFDGQLTDYSGKGPPKIENRKVVELGFLTDNVTDISPVRALVDLNALGCKGSRTGNQNNGRLVDLSPLHGMNLDPGLFIPICVSGQKHCVIPGVS